MTDDKRRKIEDTISELDLRLDGLLGKLGESLGEMIDRLDQGEDGEIRRSHEIRAPKGPLRAETGVRIRVGGASFGSPGSTRSDRQPAQPVDPRDLPASDKDHEAPDNETAATTGGPASDTPGSTPDASAAPFTPEQPIRVPDFEEYAAAGRWHLCADLPGVTLPDIAIDLEPPSEGTSGGALRLATRGARSYEARHPLPDDVDPEDMSLMLRNGVLEISFGLKVASS
jgi:HSP20 family molecular chaperone IbpA